MRPIFVSLLCALCLMGGALPSSAQTEGDPAVDFDSLLEEIGNSSDIVGLAVAVVRDGEVESMRTFGVRSLDGLEPIDEETVFRLASVSKGIASSVVGQMVSEERISLSAPASSFSETLQLKNSHDLTRLTLEDVLSHRSGLPPYAYDNLLEAGISPAIIRGRYAEVDPICAVGACYTYQNVVFDTVTELIESVDGKAFSEALNTRLFEPLGMTRASASLDGLQRDDNWARPYQRKRGGPWQQVEIKDAYYAIPAAGGANASISDMAIWLRAQMGYHEEVLAKDVLAMIHAPRVTTRAELRRLRNGFPGLEAASYGLGWRIYDFAGDRVISHFGSVDYGFGAQITFIPSKDVGIVVLTNSRSKGYSKIVPAFLERELAANVSSR
ncbi:MAG: serine hydrolase domain-containing protein [Pseudomonadota bacterium]